MTAKTDNNENGLPLDKMLQAIPEEWRFQVQAEQSLLGGDHETMKNLIASATLFEDPGEMEPERLELMMNLSLWQAEPAMEPGPFDFGNRQYYQRGIDLYTEATKKGYIRNNSIYIWWTRLIFGHRTLLYRLGSKVDYHGISIWRKKPIKRREEHEDRYPDMGK